MATFVESQYIIDSVNAELDNLKTLATNMKTDVTQGKADIAKAITAKGIATPSDASFATLVSNIGKIVQLTGRRIEYCAGKGWNQGDGSSSGSCSKYVDVAGIYLGVAWYRPGWSSCNLTKRGSATLPPESYNWNHTLDFYGDYVNVGTTVSVSVGSGNEMHLAAIFRVI